MEKLIKFIHSHVEKVSDQVASALIILIIGIVIIKIVNHLVNRSLKKSPLDETMHAFIKNSVKVGMWLFLAVIILGKLGVSTGTFVTVIGSCGIAIALALKESLSNFAGGIIIIVSKPFERGDLIEACGVVGRARSINLLYSTFVTLDKKVITIPNGSLASGVLVNYSRAEVRRVDVYTHLEYDTDMVKVRHALRELVNEAEFLVDAENTTAVVWEHEDNGILVQIRAWCNTPDFYPAHDELMEKILLKFKQYGIEVANPHMDIFIDKVD